MGLASMKSGYAKRRKLEINMGGNYSNKEWADLKARYENKCLACGLNECERPLTADHVIPLSLGGSNEIINIQPLCKPCNSRKYTKTTDYRIKEHMCQPS